MKGDNTETITRVVDLPRKKIEPVKEDEVMEDEQLNNDEQDEDERGLIASVALCFFFILVVLMFSGYVFHRVRVLENEVMKFKQVMQDIQFLTRLFLFNFRDVGELNDVSTTSSSFKMRGTGFRKITQTKITSTVGV